MILCTQGPQLTLPLNHVASDQFTVVGKHVGSVGFSALLFSLATRTFPSEPLGHDEDSAHTTECMVLCWDDPHIRTH